MSTKERFFEQQPTDEPPPSDADNLQNWSRRITTWISYVERKIRELDHLPAVDQDTQRDVFLHNPHVTRLYRPSFAELQALLRIGVRYPFATQELQGYLRLADNAYSHLDDGPHARDALAAALVELRDAIDATAKAVTEGNTAPPEINGQVKWSRFMPLTQIAERLFKDGRKWRKCKQLYADLLEQHGGKGSKNWRIRLDKFDSVTQKLFDRA